MTIPPSDEKQGQAQAEFSKMLDLQKQLRREISFARENGKVSQEALHKLADTNKKISRLMTRLNTGRLFDGQMEIEF